MNDFPSRIRPRFAWFAWFGASFLPLPVLAHHPHDVVHVAALSATAPPRLLVQVDGSVSDLLVSTDLGDRWRTADVGLRNSQVRALAFSPAFSSDSIAFLLTRRGTAGDDFDGGLQMSTDGGRSWLPPSHPVDGTHLALSPGFQDDRTLFYSSPHVLYRSVDGGSTDVAVLDVFPAEIAAIELSESFQTDAAAVVVTTGGEIFATTDGGDSWTSRGRIGVGSEIRDLELSPQFAIDGTAWLATWGSGVIETTDHGETWHGINAGLDDFWVNDVAVTVERNMHTVLYAATREGGVFRRRRSGKFTRLPLNVPLSSQSGNHFYRILPSPQYASDGVLAACLFEGLFVSRDRGVTWEQSNLNPTRSGRKIVVPAGVGIHGRVIASGYGEHVLWSGDGGMNWETRALGYNGISCYSIAAAPGYPDPPVLLSGVGGGVRVSYDEGMWWKRHELPLLGDGEVVYRCVAFSPNFEVDRTMWAFSGSGHYVSRDGGRSWTGSPPVLRDPVSLAVSPAFARDSTMFLAGHGRTDGGVLKSTDGGRTWRAAGNAGNLRWANDLRVSPNYERDGRVYLYTSGGTLVLSRDWGENWERLPTQLPSDPSAIAVVAGWEDVPLLIVGTRGDGVFATADEGVTWERLAPPAIGGVVSLAASSTFVDDGGLIAGTYEGFWRSTDWGAHWRMTTTREIYDDRRMEPIVVEGPGMRRKDDPTGHGGTVTYVDGAGSRLSLRFEGEGVQWVGPTGPQLGIAQVELDGRTVAEVDLYSADRQARQMLYGTEVARGVHRIEIVWTGRHNINSAGTAIGLDYLLVELSPDRVPSPVVLGRSFGRAPRQR